MSDSDSRQGLSRELDDLTRNTEPGEWPFEIPEDAAGLFEALPEAFTFNELLEAAETRQISSETATGYLRTFQAEEMITSQGDRFMKSGRVPYF